jgi:2-C-methyl-D-erythritol 2,4-cyclodiphosphate synthase
MRVGLGVDAHGFDASRPLRLGGVEIAGQGGLAGHSDADVLCHAIADALLGAAGLSDLGTLFPNDERWRDAPSLDILAESARAIGREGWTVVNVDASLLAEAPRIAPRRVEMVRNIAAALGVAAEAVWVKATTTDRLGFVGRSEGMAALAVALVEKH